MPTSAARVSDFQVARYPTAQEIVDPITTSITPGARKVRRHYGFHPFQGRKDPNLIQTYILHHTRPGDLVLDVFGGSGTTAREALVTKRRVLVVDVNPVAELITRA